MKKVLIAEDEKDLAVLEADILSRAGYEPVICADGAEAWKLLEKGGAPDMAVLDIMMPRMNGFELCRRIRADPRFESLPILMLTILDGDENQVEGYGTGADDYLAKPFNPDVLLARLQALERRTLGSQSL